jgi:hypothetical protein
MLWKDDQGKVIKRAAGERWDGNNSYGFCAPSLSKVDDVGPQLYCSSPTSVNPSVRTAHSQIWRG